MKKWIVCDCFRKKDPGKQCVKPINVILFSVGIKVAMAIRLSEITSGGEIIAGGEDLCGGNLANIENTAV